MSRPEVTLAIPAPLRERLLHPVDLDRLARVAQLTTLDSTADLHSAAEAGELAATEVLVTGWGTGCTDLAVLDAAPALRAIVHTGGSVRSIVSAEVLERGLLVTSQTLSNAQPVAEFTVAMIMLAGKDAFRAARVYRTERTAIDREERFADAGLFRRRVGLVGLSRISRKVIELLRPFDVEILAYSRHLSPTEAAELGVTAAGLDEIFSTCEVISLHSAATPKTRHMVDRGLLQRIQPGATLINTARGALIDQDALIEELTDGRFDAILDVADPDVTVPDSPLWELPNVLLTPHFAGAVGRELWRLGSAAVDDVLTILAGGTPSGVIDPAAFQTQA